MHTVQLSYKVKAGRVLDAPETCARRVQNANSRVWAAFVHCPFPFNTISVNLRTYVASMCILTMHALKVKPLFSYVISYLLVLSFFLVCYVSLGVQAASEGQFRSGCCTSSWNTVAMYRFKYVSTYA